MNTPLAKETPEQPTPEQACRNCHTLFRGHYCPQCGQSVKDYQRPIRFLIVDFAGNVFAFDTRVWRTLITLLFRPGKMETEYTEGKRARYMPPFRMYVFMSFVFFLLLSWSANRSVDRHREALGSALSQSEMEAALPPEEALSDLPMQVQVSPHEASSEVIGNIREVLDNPRQYLTRFFKYLSWALFLLMPLYGFFLWVMFRKTRKYYLSHFLLSSNQHVFIFLILMIMILIQLAFPHKTASPEAYLLYLVPLYSLAGAKKLYGRSWIRTLLKLAVAVVVYSIVAGLATGLVVYLSFF